MRVRRGVDSSAVAACSSPCRDGPSRARAAMMARALLSLLIAILAVTYTSAEKSKFCKSLSLSTSTVLHRFFVLKLSRSLNSRAPMAVLNFNVPIHIWKTLKALFIMCNIVTMRAINYEGKRPIVSRTGVWNHEPIITFACK